MKMRLRIGPALAVTVAAASAALAIEVAPALAARFAPAVRHHALANTVSLSSASVSVSEGDSGTKSLNFPLAISPAAPPGGITLAYTVTDGTATAGSDYTDPGNDSVTIPQGQTSFALPITVIGDTFKEADETFTVALTGASGGYGAAGSATGTITNDDYQCGSPAVTPCWSTFQVDNGAPPAGLQLQTTTTGGNIQVQLKYNNNLELSTGGITSSNVVHAVIELGSYDPVVFGTTGQIESFSETSGGSANSITLDFRPKASSWRGSPPGCTTQSCGSDVNPVTADNDYASVVLGFISDMSSFGLSSSLKDAMRGTWLGTNAQAFSFPTFNAATGAVAFTVAAPHFKTDGSTPNTGFFQFFVPDAFVEQMGIADPATVTNGSFTVTNSNGGTVVFDVSHQSAPAGVLIEAGTNPPALPEFSYSTPTFTVAKAATVPGAPTDVSASAGNGQATVSFTAPASDGGAAISSYTVTASPGGATATGGASPITVTGLTNGTSYTFTVTAANSVGSGAASAASAAVTPSAPASSSSGQSSASEPVAAVTVTEQSGSTTSASIVAGEAASLSLSAPAGAPAAAAPSVLWSSGTFTSDVTVTAVTAAASSSSTPPALSGFSAGSVAVALTFSSGGGDVHTFAEPLEIVFPDAAAHLAPGYSSDDGATWRAIPLLAGTTLPAGQQDGYYRDAVGAVHVLTLHASYFGLLGSLVLHTGNRPSFPVGSKNIFVFLAPEREAGATVALETRKGVALRTMELTLPAGTTRLKIPLPAGLKAGLYLVKVSAATGPASTKATLLVRLGGSAHG